MKPNMKKTRESYETLSHLLDQHALRGFVEPIDRAEPEDRCLQRGSYSDGLLHLGVQLADALTFAHNKGVFHLDLKPSNVLVTDAGTPRLLDFNLRGPETMSI